MKFTEEATEAIIALDALKEERAFVKGIISHYQKDLDEIDTRIRFFVGKSDGSILDKAIQKYGKQTEDPNDEDYVIGDRVILYKSKRRSRFWFHERFRER